MIERSKKPPSRARASSDELAVVLESVRGEFRVFGEALAGFQERVAHDFADVRGDIARLQDAVVENTRELGRQGQRIDDLARAVEKKVDRDEVEAIVERAVRRNA